MQKINFKNLPDTSTPLNASTLNQMQDNIESAIDSVASDIPTVVDSLSGDSTTDAPSVHAVNEKIDGITTYSTSEIKIGTWIDNKPIYRKTITGTTDSSLNETTFTISNMEIPIKPIEGYLQNENDYVPLQYSNPNASIYYFIENNNIIINVSAQDFYNKPIFFTIEYTKTTD